MSDQVWFHGVFGNTVAPDDEKQHRLGHFWYGKDPRDWQARGPDIEWIDSGYAPRRWKTDLVMRRNLVKNPEVCWAAEGLSGPNGAMEITYDTIELDQGLYLVHHSVPDRAMRTGRGGQMWTVMSWWDRCQGDTRGACNSSLVVPEQHSLNGDEMIMLLQNTFPQAVINLKNHGVTLREVIQ